MSKITARDAQVFVAGAIASQGLHSLLHLPHTLAISRNYALPIAEAIGALALPLGIAILIKNIFAVPIAYVYLWVAVILGSAALVFISYTSGLRVFQNTFVRDAVITVAGQIILLGLLFWSRRKERRDNESGAPNPAMQRAAPHSDG